MATNYQLIFYFILFTLSNTSLFGQSINSEESTVTLKISNFGMGSVDGSFGGRNGYNDGIFTGDFTIKRKDYKIGPNGGFMVVKEVKIQIVCNIN